MNKSIITLLIIGNISCASMPKESECVYDPKNSPAYSECIQNVRLRQIEYFDNQRREQEQSQRISKALDESSRNLYRIQHSENAFMPALKVTKCKSDFMGGFTCSEY